MATTEKINKVLVNVSQSLTNEEKAQARTNIDSAQNLGEFIAYGYPTDGDIPARYVKLATLSPAASGSQIFYSWQLSLKLIVSDDGAPGDAVESGIFDIGVSSWNYTNWNKHAASWSSYCVKAYNNRSIDSIIVLTQLKNSYLNKIEVWAKLNNFNDLAKLGVQALLNIGGKDNNQPTPYPEKYDVPWEISSGIVQATDTAPTLDGTSPYSSSSQSYSPSLPASGGDGSKIYATIADAVADAANLSVGDFFETNGFNTNGDMGGSRYLVSGSGTANGMDIIQLAAGKLAVLQDRLAAYPEQLGYDRYSQQDLTPVLERMAALNIRTIKLRDCGSDNYPYLMKTTWNINTPDIEIVGYTGFTTGYAPRIWFNPTSYGTTTTPMFNLMQRGFKFKNCVLMNRPWFTSSDSHNCVCIQMAVANTNNMWYEFEELAIQGFDIGIYNTPALDGSGDGLQWHCTFKKLAMALNNKNIYFKGLTYLTRFENCFFTSNRSGSQSVALEESFTIEFDCCNFGIYNPADTIIKFNKWVVSGAPVDMRYTSAKFTNCNFEIESDANHPLPTSNKGYFFKFDDDDDFHVELDNCFLISTPLARNNIYGCRAISLGNHTTIKISNSCGSYADVNYSGNEFYEWDYQKRIFDESRPPKQELESVIIEHCEGIIEPPNFAWGHVYIPCVKTDLIGCPQCDDSTDFIKKFPNAKDGVVLFNMDGPNLVVKNGGSLVQVTSPASNKVKIGDRIYNYVVIDGRKWITENLQLYTMGTRQYRDYNHQDFGFYYGTDSFAEIDALLPTGWRRPNQADCQSLVNQGYAALQSTGYSVWPNATNSSGFSAIPSDKYNKPNASPTFNRVWYWGPEDSGVGWKAIWIRPTDVQYSGWTYSDAASKQCNIRVCADA